MPSATASRDRPLEPAGDCPEPNTGGEPGGGAAGGDGGEGGGGGEPCSVVDLLKRHLEQAQCLLAEQHGQAVQLLAARADPAGELGSRLAALLAENEALRTKLATKSAAAQGEAPGAELAGRSAAAEGGGAHLAQAAGPAAAVPVSRGASLEILPAAPDPPKPAAADTHPHPAVVMSTACRKDQEPPSTACRKDQEPPSLLPGQLGMADGAPEQKLASSEEEPDLEDDVNRLSALSPPRSTHTAKGRFELLHVWATMHQKFSTVIPRASDTSSILPGHHGGELEVAAEIDERKIMGVHQPTGIWRYLIMHPYDFTRCAWDVISMLLVFYDMIMIPMGFFDLPETGFLKGAAWTTRLFWTSDMPMSFMSGFVKKDGTIEMRPAGIAKKYLKTWFALDFLVVGIDWVELLISAIAGDLGFARMGKASRVIRIMRMIRLLRLARVGEIINMLCERLPSERLVILCDIAKLMVVMMSAGHLIACLWYAVGKDSPPNKNWIDAFFIVSDDLDLRYIVSLRWALSQFTGGMDEVTPVSFSEHFFAAWVFLMAFWSGAVFLSLLTSQMTQLYLLGSQQAQQLNVMRRYLAQNGVSKGLSLRVQRNAQHALHSRQKAMPESAVTLVALVSEPMRMELHFEMFSPGLNKHPFFSMYTKKCPYVVRRICHSAMSMSSNAIGDNIFHTGEISNAMLILSRGKLRYTWGERSALLDPGSWICEPPLWVRWSHRGRLQSLEDSILLVFNAKAFQDIVTNFEGTSLNPVRYARDLVAIMNSSPDDVSDLPLTATMKSRMQHRAFTQNLLGGGGMFRSSIFNW